MKSILSLCLMGMLSLGLVSSTRANRAPVQPPVKKTKGLVVEIKPNLKKAQLIVPKKFLKKDDARGAWLTTPTIATALCLSLAFVSGGLWLVRRGGDAQKVVAGLLVGVMLMGAGGALVWANGPRPPLQPKLPDNLNVAEDVEVIIVEKGETVRLMVNPAQALRMNPGLMKVPPKTPSGGEKPKPQQQQQPDK